MQEEPISDNKRIAKNTIYLYFRMLITLVVGLFTSRIVLNTLGVEDYGINNVVGGVVSMFALFSGAISGSISRFLTFELGKGDLNSLKKVFSTSLTIMVILAIIVFIVAEIIGIWFLNTELQIPPERMEAAHWVFHCAIISFAIGLINMPFNASIISHERMNVYAYMSILDVIFRLSILYLIVISPYDKLKTYSVLGVIVTVIVNIIYMCYCMRKFPECRLKFTFIKRLFNEIFSFATWELIGSSAAILRTQGGNILINIFTKTTLANAAAGIAGTLSGIITGFVSNFTTAFTPQITKLYASQKYNELINIIYMGSKFAPYMMLVLALPVIFNAHYIINLWLGQVPEHTVNFVILTIIFSYNELTARPLITAKLATGKIKIYQIAVGGVLLLTLPIAYIALKLGAPVEAVYAANLLTSIIAVFVRLYMLRGDIPGLDCRDFLINVYCRVVIVAILSSIIPLCSYMLIDHKLYQFLTTSLLSVLSTFTVIYYVGCNKHEKEFIRVRATGIINKILHR